MIHTLDSPEQLHHFSLHELKQLAQECREHIIHVTSKKGGHLASSLGAVELTVALLHIFNPNHDRIIWDTGHQAYAYKILTGRYESFHTLSEKGGIKKFLSMQESPYDHFGAGHASTAISAGLGMAVARDILQQQHRVIAILGDGALTGGLSFEALNHNGALAKNMIVILNDNGMSIDPNVGAISTMITKLTSSKTYNFMRDEAWHWSKKMPFAEVLQELMHKFEVSAKMFFSPIFLFEPLGWRYFGPVDGHSLDSIIDLLSHVKELKGPIVIHALTQKGKGYRFAEEDAFKYHGVSPFIPDDGQFIGKTKQKSYSNILGEELDKIMAQDDKVCVISPAMLSGSGIFHLLEKYPERIFDVGIAEGHATTFAAGLATSGVKPFLAIYSTFLQRSIDNVIHDIALQNLPVKLMIDRAGLVGPDGPTHHGVFDLTYLRMIPNMTILAPKDGIELQDMIQFAYQYEKGPIALRYPRGNAHFHDDPVQPIQLGKSITEKEGKEIVIFAVGTLVHEAWHTVEALTQQGYDTALINVRFVKPLDTALIQNLASQAKLIVTIEENTICGGFGASVLELLSQYHFQTHTLLLAVPDEFIEQASPQEQREICNLSSNQILQAILSKIHFLQPWIKFTKYNQ